MHTSCQNHWREISKRRRLSEAHSSVKSLSPPEPAFPGEAGERAGGLHPGPGEEDRPAPAHSVQPEVGGVGRLRGGAGGRVVERDDRRGHARGKVTSGSHGISFSGGGGGNLVPTMPVCVCPKLKDMGSFSAFCCSNLY